MSKNDHRSTRAWIEAFKAPIRFAYRPPNTPEPEHLISLLRDADDRLNDKGEMRKR